MKIPDEHIRAIESLGYTADEARFLYVVATHSGYFVARQFIAFTGPSWGKRSPHFTDKLESRGHVTWREYQDMGGVYHLFSKTLYRQIAKICAIAGVTRPSSFAPAFSCWILSSPTRTRTSSKPNTIRSTSFAMNSPFRRGHSRQRLTVQINNLSHNQTGHLHVKHKILRSLASGHVDDSVSVFSGVRGKSCSL